MIAHLPAPNLHHSPAPQHSHSTHSQIHDHSTHATGGGGQPQAQTHHEQQPPPPQQQQPNGNANGHHSSSRQPPHRQEKERVDVLAVPAMTPEGQVLVDQTNSSSVRSYTLQKVVGDGSFGTVWLCDWHSTLPPNTPLSPMQCGAGARMRPEWSNKRLVAVKRMKKTWEGGWDECKQLKELESLRIIPPHPNIIPLYDYFLLPASKELYFVFECMEGNLYQLIKSRKGKPLAGGLVASIFRQVVTGLHHIHASGYFHRDMKPENLLVTTTGLQDYAPTSPLALPGAPPDKDVTVIVKLADFGLARETRSLPPYTEYVSTRWYRAPEVLLHFRDYSNPVDMWAFGTILAELVNLKPLFPGQQELDQVARICEILGDPSDAYGLDERRRLRGGGKWTRGVKMAKARGFLFPQIEPVKFANLFEPSVPTTLVDCITDLLKYDPDARLTSAQCLNHPYLLDTAARAIPPRPHGSRSSRAAAANGGGLPAMSPRSVPPSHSHSSQARQAQSIHAQLPRSAHHTRQPPHHAIPVYPSSQSNPSLARIPHPHAHDQLHASGNPARDLFQQIRGGEIPKADLSGSVWDEDERAPPSAISSSVYSYTGLGSDGPGGGRDWGSQADGPDPMFNQSRTDAGRFPAIHSYDERTQNGDANGFIPDNTRMDITKNESIAPSHPQQKHSVFGFKPKGWFGGKRTGNMAALPPVDEMPVPSSSSTPSLKRTQSGSTSDSRSLSELSPVSPPPVIITPAITLPLPNPNLNPKQAKKEEEKAAREVELARRAMKQKLQREKSRAVMMKREQLIMAQTQGNTAQDFSYARSHTRGYASSAATGPVVEKGKQPMAMAGQNSRTEMIASSSSKELLMRNAAQHVVSGGPMDEQLHGFGNGGAEELGHRHRLSVEDPQRNKARRRDLDDDHSMSSADFRSTSRLSFATVDSDPGPYRSRHRGSTNSYSAISRATSVSSLRTSFSAVSPNPARGFSPGARSSCSLDQGSIQEFDENASVNGGGSDVGSPSLQRLSLHTAGHQSQPWGSSHSPPPMGQDTMFARRLRPPSSFANTLPPIAAVTPPFGQHGRGSSPNSPFDHLQGLPGGHPSPGLSPHSAIIPMFQVPPLPPESMANMQHATTPTHERLPPFSHLAFVADSGSDMR